MSDHGTPARGAGGPPPPAARHRRAGWGRRLLVLAAAAAALAVVPGFTGASAPGPSPARLAWWVPPSHSDVVLHLWAAESCEHRGGWFTTRTALERVTVAEGPDEIVVTAHLAAESVRSSASSCDGIGGPIAVDVRLHDPVGSRVVLDGRCRPLAPPAEAGQRPGGCP